VLHSWPAVVGVTSAGKTSTAIRGLSLMFGPTVNGVPVVTLEPGALAVAVFTVADGGPPSALRRTGACASRRQATTAPPRSPPGPPCSPPGLITPTFTAPCLPARESGSHP